MYVNLLPDIASWLYQIEQLQHQLESVVFLSGGSLECTAVNCLQCFDVVGWAAGRASDL